MSYLHYLCFLRVAVSNAYCVVCFFVCHRLVYPILPVSLDCPILLSPSIFSNVYINNVYVLPPLLTKSKNNVVCALS